MEIEFCLGLFLILIIYEPYLGSFEVPQIIWADQVSRFDVRLLDTNKHPPR